MSIERLLRKGCPERLLRPVRAGDMHGQAAFKLKVSDELYWNGHIEDMQNSQCVQHIVDHRATAAKLCHWPGSDYIHTDNILRVMLRVMLRVILRVMLRVMLGGNAGYTVPTMIQHHSTRSGTHT